MHTQHSHFKPRLSWLLISGSLLLSSACATEVIDDEHAAEVAGQSQAIVNGTPVNPQFGAVARVLHFRTPTQTWGTCTGTLMRNDSVLTARHCMTPDNSPNGVADSDVTHYWINVGSSWRPIRRVVPAAATTDIGLLFTDGSFVINNGVTQDGTGQKLIVTTATTQSLNGITASCAGYGGDLVTLKTAQLTLTWGGGNTMFVGSIGQTILEPGDSGGPCFRFENGIPRIVGVAARQNAVTGPDSFRAWLNQQVCSFSLMPGACLP